MVQPVRPTLIAALYESQNSPWHPMGWPARILSAPWHRGMMAFLQHDSHTLSAPNVARTVAQKMARGAANMATNPLGLALSQPAPLVLLGTTAPTIALGLLNASTLVVGSGGLNTAQSLPQLLGKVFNRSRPAAAHHPLWQVILSHVLAYGAVGCLTELVGAAVGRWGRDLRSGVNASPLQRHVGMGLEVVGYSAATLCGAVLTVARLGIATLLTGFNVAAMPFAAVLGAAWALGQHVLGWDAADAALSDQDSLEALQREAESSSSAHAEPTATQLQTA